MEKLFLLNLKTKTLLFIFFLFNKFLFSQQPKDFYLTTDQIVLQTPVLVSFKGKKGSFIVNNNDFKKSKNINKLLKEGKAFLYFDDSMGIKYFTDAWIKIGTKDIECECCIKKKYTDINKIRIIQLPESLKTFYVGFTKTEIYNRNIINTENSNTFLKNDESYRIILFPKCEKSNK